MDHIPRLSEAVYVVLCRKVGSPTEVRFRREVMDTEEILYKPINIMKGFDKMYSGSRREGFRVIASDDDWMLWPPDHKVVCNLSQVSLYRVPKYTVILMECDDLPPGFTRLNLKSPSKDEKIRSSCIEINSNQYISSAIFHDNFCRFLETLYPSSTPQSHGPCATLFKDNSLDVDYAFCFRSHHWPATALPWIQRCRQQGWPSDIVISDILRSGFHVVPIGSTPDSILEWRISFSLAEQKLVYSMNHTQFLCYGLLKVFLKEVVNLDESSPFLCSYFIKTAVFWVVQTNNSLTWTPENLLPYFWECFKLLIYWVFTGECPNFFIPQNNIFRFRLTESMQTLLFNKLYELYCTGISSLLLSKTLEPFLSYVVLNRKMRVCIDESSFISNSELEISSLKEINSCSPTIRSVAEYAAVMMTVEMVISKRLTPYQKASIQFKTSEILRNTAILIQCDAYPNQNRKKIYHKSINVSRLLRFSCTLGCASDILYLAMYFYRTCRYEKSLRCLQKAQSRMTKPYIIYRDHVNVDMYERCTLGMSLGHKMRTAFVDNIELKSRYTYIDELIIEQNISYKSGNDTLYIPPLVVLHMFLILNHHRLGYIVTSQQSLRDLHTLLLYDDGVNVLTNLRDISWQILGICQEICGDFPGALESFHHSLQEDPYHNIQAATMFRITTLSQ